MDDIDLRYLRMKWAGLWSIWRSRRFDDLGDQRTGDYYASRLDDSAGVWPTLASATPFLLDHALEQQRAAVENGEKPLDVGLQLRAGE